MDNNTNSTSKEKEIYQLFKKLNVNPSMLGYIYLKEAMLMAQEDPDCIYTITRKLYPSIAAKYNTTASRVERAIRHSISVVFDSNDNTELRNEIFGPVNSVTNKTFIASLIEYMKFI